MGPITGDVVPEAMRHAVRRNPSLIPLRLEIYAHRDAPTEVKFRAVANVRHATLCAAFGLDQASFWFDMPATFIDGVRSHTGKVVDGYVMRGPRGTEPVGKLTVAWETERFRDRDVDDRRDFLQLGGG